MGWREFGTSVEFNRSQDDLRSLFEEASAAANDVSVPSITDVPTSDVSVPGSLAGGSSVPDPFSSSSVAPASTDASGSPSPSSTSSSKPSGGSGSSSSSRKAVAVARLEIKKLGLDVIVSDGRTTSDLKRGPVHIEGTPAIGGIGNSVIYGHRATYGHPFYDLQKLTAGDRIRLTTVSGDVFVYVVSDSISVVPSKVNETIWRANGRGLVLVTCTPRHSARERLVVFAELEEDPSGSPGGGTGMSAVRPMLASPAVSMALRILAAPASVDPSDQESSELSDQASAAPIVRGWFDDPGAPGPLATWGFAITAISIGAWRLSMWFRRNWVGLLVGIGPFLFSLWFFYEAVARVIPDGI